MLREGPAVVSTEKGEGEPSRLEAGGWWLGPARRTMVYAVQVHSTRTVSRPSPCLRLGPLVMKDEVRLSQTNKSPKVS